MARLHIDRGKAGRRSCRASAAGSSQLRAPGAALRDRYRVRYDARATPGAKPPHDPAAYTLVTRCRRAASSITWACGAGRCRRAFHMPARRCASRRQLGRVRGLVCRLSTRAGRDKVSVTAAAHAFAPTRSTATGSRRPATDTCGDRRPRVRPAAKPEFPEHPPHGSRQHAAGRDRRRSSHCPAARDAAPACAGGCRRLTDVVRAGSRRGAPQRALRIAEGPDTSSTWRARRSSPTPRWWSSPGTGDKAARVRLSVARTPPAESASSAERASASQISRRVSATTTWVSASRAIRFGSAMSAFAMSAKAHTGATTRPSDHDGGPHHVADAPSKASPPPHCHPLATPAPDTPSGVIQTLALTRPRSRHTSSVHAAMGSCSCVPR